MELICFTSIKLSSCTVFSSPKAVLHQCFCPVVFVLYVCDILTLVSVLDQFTAGRAHYKIMHCTGLCAFIIIIFIIISWPCKEKTFFHILIFHLLFNAFSTFHPNTSLRFRPFFEIILSKIQGSDCL